MFLSISLSLLLNLCGRRVGVAAIDPKDTMSGYLAKYNIEVEEHTVATADGYLLRAFRLPRHGAPVVLFQHGVLSSAWAWVSNSPSYAPALQVYNMGYDVWLTNSRGNTFSRQHKVLKIDTTAFWNYSFADMGREDVPANVGYILNVTRVPSLTFVGYSQGTSQTFVTLTEPETMHFLKGRVNLYVALSPVTYLGHQKSALLEVLAKLDLGAAIEALWPYGFLDREVVDDVAKFFCTVTAGQLCKFTVDIIGGISEQDSPEALTNISAHFPAGTSVKSINHYAQLVRSGFFRDYDYGTNGNRRVYGSDEPPRFDLQKAGDVPIAIFSGSKDDLADVPDVKHALSEIPSASKVFDENFDGFSHLTWVAGTETAFQQWFPKLQMLLGKYNPVGEALVI